MPRKTTIKASGEVPSVPVIECPACQSRISGDGKVLHVKSKSFEELAETAATLEQVEKAADVLEKKYEAANTRVVQLEAELKQKIEREKELIADVEKLRQKAGWY